MSKKVFIPTPEQLEEMGFRKTTTSDFFVDLTIYNEWRKVYVIYCTDGVYYVEDDECLIKLYFYPPSLESLKEFISNFQE